MSEWKVWEAILQEDERLRQEHTGPTDYKEGDKVKFLAAFQHNNVMIEPGAIGIVKRDYDPKRPHVSVVAEGILWLCKSYEIEKVEQ